MERKVFVHLPVDNAVEIADRLSQFGFRRSQGIAYRPACEACNACASARIPAREHQASASETRVTRRSAALVRNVVEPYATGEQFQLLSRYLTRRHPDGGMADMVWQDYCAMVEDSPINTFLVEYREPDPAPGVTGALVACVLVDAFRDGLSLVYSFYDPDRPRDSLGTFVILDQIRWCRELNLDHVYLGYWVAGSDKMDYKARFKPLEVLSGDGWLTLEDHVSRTNRMSDPA